MSGSLGSWPISPAANPANPAPSSTRPSRFCSRHELGARSPVHVDELGEDELDPRSAIVARISSSLATFVAIGTLLRGGDQMVLSFASRSDDGQSLHRRDRRIWVTRLSRGEREPQLDELHGDLDHQPIVATKIDPREVADPPQPLPKRVRMDVERLCGRADVAPPLAGTPLGSAGVTPLDPGRSPRSSQTASRCVADAAIGAPSAAGTCTRRAPRTRPPTPPARAPARRPAPVLPPRTPRVARDAAQALEARSAAAARTRRIPSDDIDRLPVADRGTRSKPRSESSRRSKTDPANSPASVRSSARPRLGGEHDVRPTRSHPSGWPRPSTSR